MLSPFELGLGYLVVSLIKMGVYMNISTFRPLAQPPPSLKTAFSDESAHKNDALKRGFYSRRSPFFPRAHGGVIRADLFGSAIATNHTHTMNTP
jgi:hypothetical protein